MTYEPFEDIELEPEPKPEPPREPEKLKWPKVHDPMVCGIIGRDCDDCERAKGNSPCD